MKKFSEACGGCLLVIIITALVDMLFAWVCMLIWNALVPAVFHGPHLTYTQTLLGFILLSIVAGLFKGSTSSKKD